MSDQAAGRVVIPTEEKITFKSELFEVRVLSKSKGSGLLERQRFLLNVELLDHDPLLQRTALIEVPEDVWHSVVDNEKAMARLYEDPATKAWKFVPPAAHEQ